MTRGLTPLLFASLCAVAVLGALALGGPRTAYAEGSCDKDGVNAAYVLAYSAGPPSGYQISRMNVSAISSDCLGADLTVSLRQGTTVLSGGGPVKVTGSSMSVAIASPPPAAIVTSITVELNQLLTGVDPGTNDPTTPDPVETPAAQAAPTQQPAAVSSPEPLNPPPDTPPSVPPNAAAQISAPAQPLSDVLGVQAQAPSQPPSTGGISPDAPPPATGAQQPTPTPTPRPPAAVRPEGEPNKDRPSIVDGIAGLNDIKTNIEALLTNAGLVGVLLALVLIDTTIFNSILKENSETIHGFLQRGWGPFGGFVRGVDRVFRKAPSSQGLALRPMLILLISALVYSLLDPNFGLNSSTLVLFLSLIFALTIATYVNDGGKVLIAEKTFGVPYMIQFFPAAIAIAIVSVIVSRLSDIHPGIIFGFVASAKEASRIDLTEREEGVVNYLPMMALLFVALAAWLAISPARAFAEDGGIVGAAAEASCAMLFAGSIQGLLFSLLPLKFIDGQWIWKWSKLAWLSLALPVTFFFFHTVLNQEGTLASAESSRAIVLLYVSAAAAWGLTIVAWLFFRSINPRGDAYVDEERSESSRR